MRRPIAVAGGVADDRRDDQRDDQRPDVEVAARGKQARRDQQRVAGQEEADEQAGLGEDDEDEAVEADDPNQFGDVVDGGEEGPE